MEKERKAKLNIGAIILFCSIVLILLLIIIFIVNKSLFGYKVFFSYDKNNIVIVEITNPSNLKQDDIIVYKTGDMVLQDRIIKIDSKEKSYYFTVNNYDNTQEIVLNQKQIYGKYLYEIEGLGVVAKKVPTYCIIIGMVAGLGVAGYIAKRRKQVN